MRAAALEALLEAALERGLVDDAAIAESLEQAHAMWHIRESIPLAQAEEGPNIKHDISLPVSAIADFVAATDAALRARLSRRRAWSTSATSATATCTTTCRRPEGADAASSCAHEHDDQRARLRRRRQRAAARSRPSTASAR